MEPKKLRLSCKIHSRTAQLAIAPKFCRAQFSQHAGKQGFNPDGPLEPMSTRSRKLRRLDALQHSLVRFSAALPYFLFANALVCSP
ncbi:hypothetical protein CO656_11835 [Sinorhizobium sp. FG01]|uniref:Uncharacterized protein n=1 Tax=Rhizobium fredii TaxID=380 RepID=A0A2L0HGJ9_RHIFR|nr:hypothetical protein NXT3_PC00708 [Sinorhizobium fredii]PDT41483.1 hypothetical protein CO656_11835 [Sinorhizobium sp. FG01]